MPSIIRPLYYLSKNKHVQESGAGHRGRYQQNSERHEEPHQAVRGQHLQEDGGHQDVSVARPGAGGGVQQQPGGQGQDHRPREGDAGHHQVQHGLQVRRQALYRLMVKLILSLSRTVKRGLRN